MDLTEPPIPKGEHLFMHITDTHVSTWDEGSSPEERAETEKQEAMWASFKEKFARGQLPFSVGNDEPYGDPQRISTVEAFEKQLALAEELKPEALLLSGCCCWTRSSGGWTRTTAPCSWT